MKMVEHVLKLIIENMKHVHKYNRKIMASSKTEANLYYLLVTIINTYQFQRRLSFPKDSPLGYPNHV
jgi:hypothetical protein